MKQQKSWTEKLHDPRPHAVKPVPVNIAGMKIGQVMLVPSPAIVDAFIRTIPAGSSMDLKTLRGALARQYGAEVTCPITMGFHLRTVAEAAFEARNQGAAMNELTPVWRVLDAASPTLKKLSFDPAFIAGQRKQEGIPD